MKFSRKWFPLPAGLLLAAVTLPFARADLAAYLRYLEATSPAFQAFFRAVPLPGGPVLVRRPPKETRAELTTLLNAAPQQVDLYRLRAQEAEAQLDFAASEADWKKVAELTADKGAGYLELADYYHRRLQPQAELTALSTSAQAPDRPDEQRKLATARRAWQTYHRIFALVQDQGLPESVSAAQYRAFLARFPKEAEAYEQALDFAVASRQAGLIDELIATRQRQLGASEAFSLRARAALLRQNGSTAQALALYEQAFQPNWEPALVSAYFGLMRAAGTERAFLEKTRAASAANPTDFNAAARLFHYHQQLGKAGAAQKALLDLRSRREARQTAWTAADLLTMARLFESVNAFDDAARAYYGLYSLPNVDNASAEAALGSLIRLLLSAPEQNIHLGTSDLSLYRDIAAVDQGPGFLNGLLSLVFNSSNPSSEYQDQNRSSQAYFHRAKAAELMGVFVQRFPQSSQRPALQASLIEAYATYGDGDAVIKHGKTFVSQFPAAPQRTAVVFLMADAYARKGQTTAEFAAYEELLKDLAARADHVPIGELPAAPATPAEGDKKAPQPARSPEYARVLDRYMARLVALKRLDAALAVYRRELDANPNDPGLYERLAGFLEQNKRAPAIEEVYKRAIQQFPERTWTHKLARWYLRQKRGAQFTALSQEVIRTFSGSDLDNYFRDVAANEGLERNLYVQLNAAALKRFPQNLTFVRNLVQAYSTKPTVNEPEKSRLLRAYWFQDTALRAQYFAELSAGGRLKNELQIVRALPPATAGRWDELAQQNPGAARLIAEAEAWQSHFEAAAPVLKAVAGDFPTEPESAQRAVHLYRSLAAYDPAQTDVAVAMEAKLQQFAPRDADALALIGDLYADRERLDRAKPYWDRIPNIAPGKPDGYLTAATVYWDYFQFDDALRLLQQGRAKRNDPALFAYEAGAIYEGKRDVRRAIQEYARGAMKMEATSPARDRLLALARRPAFRPVVEEVTAPLAGNGEPSLAALQLRKEVMLAEDRRAQLEQWLTQVVDRSSSVENLQTIERWANAEGFEALQDRSLLREITVSSDPVEKLRLRLQRVNLFEGRGDRASAQREIESLYRENRLVLGVVRAAVDFYWRADNDNNARRRGVDVLTEAAKASQPELRKQFTLEAARKSTDLGQYTQARKLVDELLAAEPFQPDYLLAKADSYAREGKDADLRSFYTAKLNEIKQAPMTPAERQERTATLRRAYLPVLTRMKDYAGATDQYVELINRFPEDTALLQEAGLFAIRNGQQERLLAAYKKTEAASSKDARWPAVVARLQTQFEDLPAAIEAYQRASAIRPDRLDLVTARAALQERTLKFEEALKSYEKAYQLSYHDPQWMMRAAEVHARLGHAKEAVEALRLGLMEGRPANTGAFVTATEKLENFGLLPEAREMAEKGLTAAGKQIVQHIDAVRGYARVMAMLRQHEAGLDRVSKLAAGTDAWQVQRWALEAMTQVVKVRYTPEEKAAFATFLTARRTALQANPDARTAFVELAGQSGLLDLQARWLTEQLRRSSDEEAGEVMRRLVTLQRSRLQFTEVGRALEEKAKTMAAGDAQRQMLTEAAQSYKLIGNADAELRVLSQLGDSGEFGARYLELLRSRNTAKLVERAATDDAAGNAALASGDYALAMRAVTARGAKEGALWTNAYTALTGLYYAQYTPPTQQAFGNLLGSMTIGDRVGKPVDPQSRLVGAPWFYYGARWGEYLSLTKDASAEDFLAAELEAAPGDPEAYADLAAFYGERGDVPRSLADYEHALELGPLHGEWHVQAARLLWEQGQKDAAVARWKQALQTFQQAQTNGKLTPAFWTAAPALLREAGQRGVLPQLKPDVDALMRTYFRYNGAFRLETLGPAFLEAAGSPAAGLEWLLDVGRGARDQVAFLSEIANATWLAAGPRGTLHRRLLQAAETKVAESAGDARAAAERELRTLRVQYVEYLLSQRQGSAAEAVLRQMGVRDVAEDRQELLGLQLRAAVQTGQLDALLRRLAEDKDAASVHEKMLQTAQTLLEAGEKPAARRIQAQVYERQLADRDFSQSVFLGLAEVRLEEGKTAEAVALLRRLTRTVGEPFEGLLEAGSLLLRTGHPAEAVEFLKARVQAVPWDDGAKVKLAKAQAAASAAGDAASVLAGVAASAKAPYSVRVEAAQELGARKLAASALGSGELDLLAGGTIAPAAAEKPYYQAARVQAAAQTNDQAVRIRLLLGAMEIEPEDQNARLPLLRAALAANRRQLALATLAPVLEQGGMSYLLEPMAAPAPGEPPRIEDMSMEEARRFLANTTYTAEEKLDMARDLAENFARQGRPENALVFLRLQRALEPSTAARDTVGTRMRKMIEELAVVQADEARRPVIKAGVEQPRPVRPRLAARRGGAQ